MILILLAAIVGAVSAVPVDQCRVGEWSEWSECKSSKFCSLPNVYSYPMEASTEWDTGRTKMKFMMEQKEKQWAYRAKCKAEGTCPEFLSRPMSGQYECTDGISGGNPCLNIDQLAFLDFAQLGYVTPLPGDNNPAGNDVWGWEDPLTGDEYAMMGLTGGTAFVRVTDPINPVPLAFIYSNGAASTWRDIKVIGNFAYIVSEATNHGVQVFDLTHLRSLDGSTMQYLPADALYTGLGNIHNVAANADTNFIYAIGATRGNFPLLCAGGLFVIDVKDPMNPTFAGCYGGDGYVHDTQCVVYHGPDTRYTDHEICFCFNENSFTIVDVTNKAAMTMIAKSGYINVAYTHQGWVNEDQTICLLDDELDEYRLSADNQFTKTYVWDITDLQNPTLKFVFQSTERSIDHNQYIVGDLTFQANYESGLRVLRIHYGEEASTTAEALSLVAYFDVFPSRTTSEFNGAWSVYPFFKSGTVLVSSIDFGLFLLRLDMDDINELTASRKTFAAETRTREIIYNVNGATCPHLVETKTCQAQVLC